MIKKIISIFAIALCFSTYAIESAVYGPLSSVDQLTFKTLDRGQFAYYEQDDAAELFVGARDEEKLLRVCDPAALSGYRIREFDSDLTIDPGDKLVVEDKGVYKFTIATWANNPDGYEYEQCKTNQTALAGRTYCTYDGTTYTVVSLPEGTQLNENYYWRFPYWDIVIKVYSKDHYIYKLHWDEVVRQGVFGDFYEIKESKSVEYNDRVATITLHLTSEKPTNSDWFRLSNFNASTLALGDRVRYTDLEKTKIFFKDREWYDSGSEAKRSKRLDHLNYYSEFDDPEGFDLSEVRYWAKHLYDGNRGENWSVYPAYHDVIFNTFYGLEMGSVKYSNNSTNRWKMISVDGNLQFTTRGIPIVRLEMLGSSSSEEDKCAFTGIHKDPGTDNWILEFSFQEEVEPGTVNILWRPKLEYGDWMPIGCTLTYNNAKTDYTATVPAVYSETFNSGFWKIYVPGNPSERRLRVNATISVMADDGKYYKLTFPSGGGAVTATLDENQGY